MLEKTPKENFTKEGVISDEEALRSGISKEKANEMGIEIPEEGINGDTVARLETEEAKEDKIKSLKDKILGFFGQSPEQLSSKYTKLGDERMQGNPALKQAYEKYLTTEGEEVAQDYREALGKWKYVGRDENGKFVDKTLYSSGTGDVPGDKRRNN